MWVAGRDCTAQGVPCKVARAWKGTRQMLNQPASISSWGVAGEPTEQGTVDAARNSGANGYTEWVNSLGLPNVLAGC